MHVLDALPSARIRAGWTLPAALAGLIGASVGEWLRHSLAKATTACDLLGAIEDIGGGSRPETTCSGISVRHYAGVSLAAAGALVTLVSMFVAGRRGRAAARLGQPWPVRRFLTRVAAAADRLLPGASRDGAPRLGATVVGALLSCLLLVGLLAAHNAWDDHQHNAELAHQRAAQRALVGLVLPAGITRTASADSGCSSDADTVCASSSRSMNELRPDMESLLAGRNTTVMCELIPRSKVMPCPVTVYGKIAGYPAVAIVDPHMILVRDGDPPAGAVPLHPGASRGVFFLGTDINVSLLVPFS